MRRHLEVLGLRGVFCLRSFVASIWLSTLPKSSGNFLPLPSIDVTVQLLYN